MMRIEKGDLADPRLLALLEAHLAQCRAETGPHSAHALDVAGLAAPEVDVFAGFDGEALVAVGALKRLGGARGEVKSMHTGAERRRSGAGAAMLAHIVTEARRQGLTRLSLETGAWDFFHPARRLYRRFGFRDCAPFPPYTADANSVFMTLDLGDAAPVAATRMARRGRPAGHSRHLQPHHRHLDRDLSRRPDDAGGARGLAAWAAGGWLSDHRRRARRRGAGLRLLRPLARRVPGLSAQRRA